MKEIKFEMNEEGKLVIDAFHFIHELPECCHQQLAESLSCSDFVIDKVMEQVLDGCTENGFSGSWSTGYNTPLQRHRAEIAQRSSEVAERHIKELEERLKRETEEKQKYMDKYFKLYHGGHDQ